MDYNAFLCEKPPQKGEKNMKMNPKANLLRTAIVLFVAGTLLFGAAVMPRAQASVYESSSIKLREDLKVDYSQYLDSSVMYPLPAGIDSDREISVIITVDVENLMDAYEQTDKSMSFAEFALCSSEAAALETQIAGEKARILAQLDELEIAYTTGEDYSRLLSGFEHPCSL